MKKINKERQYDFFIRYMQRESHSSTNTISDMKDIDPEIFKAAFKKIFIESKYRDHYNRMMNLDDN
ncbi:MAG: hypothetical protein LBQ59_00985 [Candidatus Peribacteria bacterium]|jgi:hypothetical protein|nr:hypothetical protein [Candidatus Peribacteria bacterium]